MPISIACPECKATFRVADEMAGKKVRCKECQGIFVVGPPEDAVQDYPPAVQPAPGTEIEQPSRRTTPGHAADPLGLEDDDIGAEERRPRRPKRNIARRDPPRSNATLWIALVAGTGVLSCCTCSVGCFGIGLLNPDPVALKGANKVVAFPNQNVAKGGGGFPIVVDPNQVKKTPVAPNIKVNNGPLPAEIKVVFGADATFRSQQVLQPTDATHPFFVENNQVVQKHCKVYVVQMEQGRSYEINLNSMELDAYLYVKDDKNQVLAEDDDGGGMLNARLLFTPTRSGTYRIFATSLDPDDVGTFTLTVRRL